MDCLEGLRVQIDNIDSCLVDLFEMRMSIALKIASYKMKNGLPILNEKREAEVIEKNLAKLKNKGFEAELIEFFKTLMHLASRCKSESLINIGLNQRRTDYVQKFRCYRRKLEPQPITYYP